MRQAGYTLLELALVIGVLSLMLGSGLALATRKTESDRLRTTQERIQLIEDAIYDFVVFNKFIPCPALGTAVEGDEEFGVSVNYNSATGACGDLTTPLPNESGVVPVRTLNLPDDYIEDGWGRKFSYAIATGMGSAADYANSNFRGNIAVLDLEGNHLTEAYKTSPDNRGAALVLWSHGNNGRGAYKADGAILAPIPSGHEAENYNHAAGNNRTYIQGEKVDYTDSVTGDAIYFDDILVFKTRKDFENLKSMVAPLRIMSDACIAANKLVVAFDSGITAPITNYNTQYNDRSGALVAGTLNMQVGNLTLAVARSINTLCEEAIPPSTNACPPGMQWTANPGMDCYCDSLAENLLTNVTNETFGGCAP